MSVTGATRAPSLVSHWVTTPAPHKAQRSRKPRRAHDPLVADAEQDRKDSLPLWSADDLQLGAQNGAYRRASSSRLSSLRVARGCHLLPKEPRCRQWPHVMGWRPRQRRCSEQEAIPSPSSPRQVKGRDEASKSVDVTETNHQGAAKTKDCVPAAYKGADKWHSGAGLEQGTKCE